MIVSLTSFPARIPHIAPCVASLVSQIESGDRLVLWLGSEQFPHGLEDVPPQIRTFSQSEGSPLVVRFTEDIRSYKKLIPALIAFPNETIVTVDDDVVYEPHALDLLKKPMLTIQKPSSPIPLATSTVPTANGVGHQDPSVFQHHPNH